MEDILAIVLFIIGLITGAAFVFYIIKSKREGMEERAQAEVAAEKATLVEGLKARDQSINNLSTALEELKKEGNHLQTQLSEEGGKRSAAEERNTRLPQLEKTIAEKDTRISELMDKNTGLLSQLSELSARSNEEAKKAEEKIVLLSESREKLIESFKALSADALNTNNQAFLQLANEILEKFQEKAKGDLELRQKSIDELVKPIKESLEKVSTEMRNIEVARVESYSKLTEQISSLNGAQAKLQLETGNLVKALRNPTVRGRWGEITLHRVVELSGMSCHCDFSEQETYATEDGNLRPDMIINLPEKRSIVVDSKTPMSAYLEALEAQDDGERLKKLDNHASAIRSHIGQLGAKAYWQQLEETPEFVVLFIPGEVFFSAALERDPELIEYGFKNGVVLATPITLIALLKVVAQGWTQEAIEENAKHINELAMEIYQRISTLSENLTDIGKGLGKAVDSYNKAVGSYERRILVTTRRLKELNASIGNDIDAPELVEKHVREISGPGES